MPEYLAPGVYIEERPGQRTIEGVATSTAGFVGMTERGPIVGPPVLVTSFGDFQRQFGGYLDLRAGTLATAEGEHGHLAFAIKQFFDNGGSRAFISRAYRQTGNFGAQPVPVPLTPADVMTTDARQLVLKTGVVVALRSNAPKGETTVYLTSLRGFANAELFREKGASPVALSHPDTLLNSAQAAAALGADYRADTAFAWLTPAIAAAGAPPNGTTLVAVDPGRWAEDMRALVRPLSGPRVDIVSNTVAPAGGTTFTLTVTSGATFYDGCTIGISSSTTAAPAAVTVYATVVKVVGNTLTVVVPLAALPALPVAGGPPPAGLQAWVNLAEVSVSLSWRTITETFRGSWRWIDPNGATLPIGFTKESAEEFNAEHSVWAQLNAVSTLAFVPADATTGALAVAADHQDDPLQSHPTTETGHPAAFSWATTDAAGHTINLDTSVAPPVPLPAGMKDNVPGFPQYVGNPGDGAGNRGGIAALEDEESIALTSVPGITDARVLQELVTQAERLKYRFCVIDGPKGANIGQIRAFRGIFDTTYAAVYHPWIELAHPLTGDRIEVPPSGSVLGIYGRSDGERGVHKAPANEIVRNAQDLVSIMTTGDQEILNPEGIDVIRDFRPHDRGIRVWGARTMSSDPEWKYVNVRRLFIYLEHSIDNGTQWVVFEPNNRDLWARVRRTIETFLEGEWKKGALFGAKPEDAYTVRCDESTMSPDDIDNGRLICEISVAPTKPAEFVVFRIGQLTLNATT